MDSISLSPVSGTSDTRRRQISPIGTRLVDLALVVVACLLPMVVFIVATRGEWILDFGGADNWSYAKYFRDWTSSDPVLRDAMRDDYKGARVAWILPGFLLHQVLPPLAASIALNVATAIASLLLTLLVAARLFGLAAGALATVLLAAYAGSYASGLPNFWSYHGVICNAFYLLLLLALAEHARQRAPIRSAALGGVAVTLLLVTSPTYAVGLPATGLYWLILRGWPPLHGWPSLRDILRDLLVAGLAGATTFSLLGLVNYLAGSQALFILPLVHATMRFSSDPYWSIPLAGWLPDAIWLGFPAVVALGSVLAIVATWRRCRELPRPLLAVTACLLGFWATLAVLEVRGQPVLQAQHIHYMVVGPAALALAGVLRWLPRGAHLAEPRLSPVVLLLVAIVATVPQVLLSRSVVDAVTSALRLPLGPAPLALAGGAIGCLLLGAVALAFVRIGRPSWSLVPAGLCFGLAWTLINPSLGAFDTPSACRHARASFDLVSDVSEWLSSRRWHGNARLWYSPTETIVLPAGCGNYPVATASGAVEQAGMVWDVATPLPERISALDPHVLRNVAERERGVLVVISTPDRAPDDNDELINWARATPAAPTPRLAARQTFRHPPLALTVQVYRFVSR